MSAPTLCGVELDALSRFSSGFEAYAGARLLTLGDGSERGVRVVEMRSGGGVEVEVAIDRGGDLGRLAYEGQTLSWHTPHGLRAPWLINAEGDNGQGFLRGVGGLLNTCGLDHIRQPESEIMDNPDVSTTGKFDYPLHGKGAFQPAKLRGYGLVDDVEIPYIFCETEFTQSMTFVSAIRLRRRIEMKVGGESISIKDVVANVGPNSTTHMMLYHFNLGFPLVAPGSQLSFPGGEKVWPANEQDPFSPFPEPEHGGPNNLSVLRSGSDVSTATIESKRVGLKLSIEYPTHQLPFCQLLRMTGTGQYGMGIEPCTTGARSRQSARDNGEMITLDPGQSRTYELEIRLEKTASQGSS